MSTSVSFSKRRYKLNAFLAKFSSIDGVYMLMVFPLL